MDRSSGMLTPHGSGDADVTDVISMARRRMSGSAAASRSAVAAPSGPMGEFLHKLKRAWEVFFPEEERTLSPKEEGKKRLRMILVADRCERLAVEEGAHAAGAADDAAVLGCTHSLGHQKMFVSDGVWL